MDAKGTLWPYPWPHYSSSLQGILLGKFVRSCHPFYIYIGLQISGFLAVKVVPLQPPNLSANDRVLLLVGVIIVVLYSFSSFTFVLLLSFMVFSNVGDSATSRLIPFGFLKVHGEACVLIDICGIACDLVRVMVGVLY